MVKKEEKFGSNPYKNTFLPSGGVGSHFTIIKDGQMEEIPENYDLKEDAIKKQIKGGIPRTPI